MAMESKANWHASATAEHPEWVALDDNGHPVLDDDGEPVAKEGHVKP